MNDYNAWRKTRTVDVADIHCDCCTGRAAEQVEKERRTRVVVEQEAAEQVSILTEAADVTSGDRQDWYGSPVDNHGCTAALWNAYLDRRALRTGTVNSIDAYDVALLNALQKISRLAHDRRRDGLVDIAGYAANAAEIVAELDAAWTT